MLALGAIPVSLLHVVFFMLSHPERTGGAETLWSTGIIAAHLGLMAVMTVLGLTAKCTNINGAAARIISTAIVPLILAVGIAVAVIDQLVTPNITPYLVACTIAAVVFITPPFLTISAYAAALLVFFITLGFVQPDEAVLLSNRVNGFTFTGIGIVLSLVLWGKHTTMIDQQSQITRQTEELRVKNEQLENLASFDPLTGLYNRRKFDKLLEHQFSCCSPGENFSLIIMDLDRFKTVNDRWGHIIGDRVLAETAQLLRDQAADGEIFARWGGEEFILALPGFSEQETASYAERLRRAIEAHSFARGSEASGITVTASFGAVVFQCCSGLTLDEIIRQADHSLYQAKNLGRNRVVSASAEPASFLPN